MGFSVLRPSTERELGVGGGKGSHFLGSRTWLNRLLVEALRKRKHIFGF